MVYRDRQPFAHYPHPAFTRLRGRVKKVAGLSQERAVLTFWSSLSRNWLVTPRQRAASAAFSVALGRIAADVLA